MPDVDDIRLTLHQLTELELAAARRVFLALRDAGVAPDEARERVARAARIAWREDRGFGEVLTSTGLGRPLRAEQGWRTASRREQLSAVGFTFR